MQVIFKHVKKLTIAAFVLLATNILLAQAKHHRGAQHIPQQSKQLKEFLHLTAEANISFVCPPQFKEIKVPNDEYFSFDYGMEIPDEEFEIWFRVKPERRDWLNYQNALNSGDTRQTNPDSLYKGAAEAQAIAFTGDKNYFVRNIPAHVLYRYNADAGKSYLLTLLDMPQTRHYKYALLITLQKDHIGTIMAVCFTNEKGPEFFKNMDKASNCLKFKP